MQLSQLQVRLAEGMTFPENRELPHVQRSAATGLGNVANKRPVGPQHRSTTKPENRKVRFATGTSSQVSLMLLRFWNLIFSAVELLTRRSQRVNLLRRHRLDYFRREHM